MSADEKAQDEVVSRLLLDIRALALLHESDEELRPLVERSFLESQDDYVRRFVGMLQRGQKSEGGGSFPMAVGQVVLASFLTIIGLAAFVPIMAGLDTPQQWFSYVSNSLASSFASGPLYEGAPILDFAFALLLLLGAFYTLRQASKNLKRTTLAPQTSER